MSEGVITPLRGQLAQQSAPSGQPCGDWTRQTGAGKEPVRCLTASPPLSPSVICTCQWEAVLTHQIIAERKLLQGGDILRWQYGDGEYILGGGERNLVLERAQITRSGDTQVHTHAQIEAYINIPMHKHFYRRLYLIFPVLNNMTVWGESNLFTARTTEQILIYLT